MREQFFHPDWSCNSNIYEVNIRQYTKEGTFKAFGEHLPRLSDMGVEILWFMPVTSISVKDRKGTLGSYYAVKNYVQTNPEFGSLTDFKDLVSTAHLMGFKVIIDWVANHTGNDNIWIDQHPDFFCYDDNQEIIHPNGWEDVTKLNFENEQMEHAMIESMKFWIVQADIDGFRCDMAHLVKLDFWKKAKSELNKVKPGLFWLAECEEPHYHEVFDATYTWKWMHASEEFVKKNQQITTLYDILMQYDFFFSKNALRTYFTSNHDENSWNGTEYDKYGNAAKVFAVFSCTWNGLPMIYSGQELPNYEKLRFFDKDEIKWTGDFELHNFYKALLQLRKRNNALNAADALVVTNKVGTNRDDKIFAFYRCSPDHSVLVVLNFSAEMINIQMNMEGLFKDVFNNQDISIQPGVDLPVEAWGYYVLEKAV